MLNPINVKYFRLAVRGLKKVTDNDISCDCPLCGDKKARLHLYHSEVGDLTHCFNEGCELSDEHHGMTKFLDLVNPNLLSQYKREMFGETISKLKGEAPKSMNDLLSRVKKKETLKPEKVLHKDNPKIPLNKFLKLKDVPEAVAYIKGRGLEPRDDWYFSKEKFVTIAGSTLYLENFVIIPIYVENKIQGFYSRSIENKQFSTFLLDNVDKVWVDDNFDPDKTSYWTEGIFDYLSTGFENGGAMISANLPPTFLSFLSDPVFLLDGDKTGIEKAIKYSEQGYKVFVWNEKLLKYKDFNKILEKGGKISAIRTMIEKNIQTGIMAKVKLNLLLPFC